MVFSSIYQNLQNMVVLGRELQTVSIRLRDSHSYFHPMQVLLQTEYYSLRLGPGEMISSEQLRALGEAFRSKAVQSGTHGAGCNARGPGPVPSGVLSCQPTIQGLKIS